MDKNHAVLRRMGGRRDDDFVPGMPEERIHLVCPLTREMTSLEQEARGKRLNEGYRNMLHVSFDGKNNFHHR